MKKFFWRPLLALLTALALPLAARTVHDIENNPVELPEKVSRVADLWNANNQIVLLLGGGDKLVATTEVIRQNPWFSLVYPRIKQVPALSNGQDIQAEELLATKAEVVLLPSKALQEQVQRAGLKALLISFKDFDGLKKTVRITAAVLGDGAPAVAEEYIRELDGNIEFVRQRLADLKAGERPRVLHIVDGGDNLLEVDGGKTIVGSWIEMAGGTKLWPEAGNSITVSLEEIIRENPQVIIIGSFGGQGEKAVEKIKAAPEWANIDAVKNSRIYANPLGTFAWDRYSAEEALQVLWAAKTLHPEKFEDVDMAQKTKDFYKKYYNFELSDDQTQRILKGQEPEK